MIPEPEFRAKPGRFAGHDPQANETGRSGCDTRTDAGDHNRNNQAILHHPSDSVYHSIFGVALHHFNPALRLAQPHCSLSRLLTAASVDDSVLAEVRHRG
jgi:hypothetical protein